MTLESAYDDWTVSEVAKAIGKQDDATYFAEACAQLPECLEPRDQVHVTEEFRRALGANTQSIRSSKRRTGRVETTAPEMGLLHGSIPSVCSTDPEGLIQLMGGRDAFNTRLDQLFVEQYGTSKYSFLDQFPDATGLVGLYAQGNEPSFPTSPISTTSPVSRGRHRSASGNCSTCGTETVRSGFPVTTMAERPRPGMS